MNKPRYKLFLPLPLTFGNIHWPVPESEQERQENHALYQRVRDAGVWCSLFPEEDGFCFSHGAVGHIDAAMLTTEYYEQALALFKGIFGEDIKYTYPPRQRIFVVPTEHADANGNSWHYNQLPHFLPDSD